MKMIIKLLCAVLAFSSIAAPANAGIMDSISSYFKSSAPTPPPTIKVLIAHDRPGVLLEVKGKYKMFDPHTGDHISTRFNGKRKFIQGLRDGLRWGEEFPGVFQIMIVPDETTTTTIVDGVEYRGPIFVYDIGGTISVVNQVYIEDYLSATLAQRYKQLPEEALNAIVIAARTAAYYRIENPRSQFFSVDGANTGYQGYAAIEQNSPTEKAIQATRYMVMSQPTAGSDTIVPFAADWRQTGQTAPVLAETVLSKITIGEADAMAQKGDHAAQILAKAFPGVKIELVHYTPEVALRARKGQN